ncbi:dihydroorotase domain protein [Mycobacterium xenopi 4042]|uniref:Dihydroorotase domain protein n=1 Tax=Mycobacterium xenopi 4042 TaxID=1299334 RepID=X8C092_MYCXE|nr:dihydroorotase domain protein [Mycobacterium xenopi 4042]
MTRCWPATRRRVHICHASTAGTVEILNWAKAQGISITAEVTRIT